MLLCACFTHSLLVHYTCEPGVCGSPQDGDGDFRGRPGGRGLPVSGEGVMRVFARYV